MGQKNAERVLSYPILSFIRGCGHSRGEDMDEMHGIGQDRIGQDRIGQDRSSHHYRQPAGIAGATKEEAPSSFYFTTPHPYLSISSSSLSFSSIQLYHTTTMLLQNLLSEILIKVVLKVLYTPLSLSLSLSFSPSSSQTIIWLSYSC